MPHTQWDKNGAEVLLEQLESQGVDCIFASPIAVMAPVWEALALRGNEMKLPDHQVAGASWMHSNGGEQHGVRNDWCGNTFARRCPADFS